MEFNLKDLIEKGKIGSEVEYERALIADRQLRLLAKKDPSMAKKRKALKALILEYDERVWDRRDVTGKKLEESDTAEEFAERERQFFKKRKELITQKLKNLKLTQQELGKLLGHNNKSYISELMNGVNPFTVPDLVAISSLLSINIKDLIPPMFTFHSKLNSIKKNAKSLDIMVNEQRWELKRRSKKKKGVSEKNKNPKD